MKRSKDCFSEEQRLFLMRYSPTAVPGQSWRIPKGGDQPAPEFIGFAERRGGGPPQPQRETSNPDGAAHPSEFT
jgi:hypothetical protein